MGKQLFGILLLSFLGTSAQAKTKLSYPLPPSSAVVTAYYDLDRGNGLKDWGGGKKTYQNHTGTDFGIYGRWSGMAKGVWVYAAADGTVVEAHDGQSDRCSSGKCTPCFGNYVKLSHGGGIYTYYLHFKKGSVRVRKGQKVKCGDKLGQVGSSGCSTGPHLHFQINTASRFSAHHCPYAHNDWVSKGKYLGLPAASCQSGGGGNPNPSTCYYVKPARLGGAPLRVRSQPTTRSSILTTVREGDCLKVLAVTKSGQSIGGNKTWYKIKANGKTGWISGYYADCSNCGPAPACRDGEKKACYTGSSSTRNRGECRDGQMICSGGKWGSCKNERRPTAEKCDGKDNDCDGQIDENNPQGGGQCSTGKAGPCSEGIRQCQNGHLVCVPKHKPSSEKCDGKDNDCNGQIDDGLSKKCYTGPANTQGKGICKAGQSICINGHWSPCQNEVKPKAQEICGNGQDDDCNGQIDDGCSPQGCKEGEQRECYTGPSEKKGVGVCQSGHQTCHNGQWGSCEGEILPASKEVCGNNRDDDCNGQIDDGCSPAKECVDRDGDGYMAGEHCQAKELDCDDNDKSVHPHAIEVCGNGKDDDCQGGDQPCGQKMPFGEQGCKKNEDCASGLCLDRNDISICTKSCKTEEECPDNYECLAATVCWPTTKTQGNDQALCKTDKDCLKEQRCQNGHCVTLRAPSGGCSCSTQTPSSSNPSLPFLFLILFFLPFFKRKKRRLNTQRP